MGFPGGRGVFHGGRRGWCGLSDGGVSSGEIEDLVASAEHGTIGVQDEYQQGVGQDMAGRRVSRDVSRSKSKSSLAFSITTFLIGWLATARTVYVLCRTVRCSSAVITSTSGCVAILAQECLSATDEHGCSSSRLHPASLSHPAAVSCAAPLPVSPPSPSHIRSTSFVRASVSTPPLSPNCNAKPARSSPVCGRR